MSSKKVDPGQLHAEMKSMKAGLGSVPPGLTSLSVLGVTYTLPDLGAKIGAWEAVYDAAESAAVAAKTARENREAIAAQAQDFMNAAIGAFKSALGKNSAALQALGITPNKIPAPLTVEQQQAKVAKAKATRIARHTMGPKAKSKIKGTSTPTTPTTP